MYVTNCRSLLLEVEIVTCYCCMLIHSLDVGEWCMLFVDILCYTIKSTYLPMPKLLVGWHYNEEEISRHLKKEEGYWPVQTNGNKFTIGQILKKPVKDVKERILAGWAQKSPEPWSCIMGSCIGGLLLYSTLILFVCHSMWYATSAQITLSSLMPPLSCHSLPCTAIHSPVEEGSRSNDPHHPSSLSLSCSKLPARSIDRSNFRKVQNPHHLLFPHQQEST